MVMKSRIHTADILAVNFIDLCHISREWKRFARTSLFASEKKNVVH